MNLVRVHIRIISIMSVMIWSTAARVWETTIWIIVWHSWFASININKIISGSNINSVVMIIVWLFLIALVFLYMLTINIRNINYILTMLRNRFTIINFIIFNIERIFIIRIYKFAVLVENIVPIVIVLKSLSEYILYLPTIHGVSIKYAQNTSHLSINISLMTDDIVYLFL